MLPTELLWDSLPDPLPAGDLGRFRRIRSMVSRLAAVADEPRPPLGELAARKVRRGAVQAVVREAYQSALAEQDDERRNPAQFAEAWRGHLARLLARETIEASGWGLVQVSDIDTDLAWELYEVARYARHHAIERAEATHSRRLQWGNQQVQAYDFEIVTDGGELGAVRYGICLPCANGLLYKISFDPDCSYSA